MKSFVLIGTGWRAMFYVRVASFLPSMFSIASVYTRSQAQKTNMGKLGLKAFTDINEALKVEHDGVIVASGENGFYEVIMDLHKRNETILAETSFLSLSDTMLNDLEDVHGYTLEQWQFNPLFSGIFNSLDLIGNSKQVNISYLHNHHAASIARRLLGITDQKPMTVGTDFNYRCIKTADRDGRTTKGEKQDCSRKLRILNFDNKGLFINDFTTNQYHNFLYDSHIEIRGERGTITQKGVTYLNKDNVPICNDFVFHRDICVSNASLSLSHISLGDRVVYQNPFYPLNMDDDEIAIATMLMDFDKGKLDYSILDGIRDARLGKLL